MLEVAEYFDIKRIEKIRKSFLNKGLDDKDNFSLHCALLEGKKVHGVGRLYRNSDSREMVIDNIALAEDIPAYREMIFRTLLLKCFYLECEKIYAKAETIGSFYEKFHMKNDGDFYVAKIEDIVFPSDCQKK